MGNPTFGYHHKIVNQDPEFGLPVGTDVSNERIEEALEFDLQQTVIGVNDFYYP